MSTPSLAATDGCLTAPDGGRFSVTWLNRGVPGRQPIVYLPGMFTGRSFWLSDRGVGLAGFLAAEGFPGIIVQRREFDCGARPGLKEHLEMDLPLVQRLVEEVWGCPAFWIGHSFGGVLAARAAAETLVSERVAGLVLFASQFEVGKHSLHPPLSWLTQAMVSRLGYMPARALKLGPRDEPPEAIIDCCSFVTRGRNRPQIRSALARITAPVLAISGAADRIDPARGCQRLIQRFASSDKQFITAGHNQGFSRDYDHPGIVASKPAQQEIWPLVRDWLLARATPSRAERKTG